MAFITPKTYPLYNIVKGNDWRIKIPVVDADGEAFDFSGWQAHAQVRTKSSGTLIAEFDTYDATIEFDGGDIYLIRDKDDTDITPDEYVYDCQFHDTDGLRRTLILESIFEIVKQVTV